MGEVKYELSYLFSNLAGAVNASTPVAGISMRIRKSLFIKGFRIFSFFCLLTRY